MLSTLAAMLAQSRKKKAEEARMHEMTAAVTQLRNELAEFRKTHGRYPHALNELPRIPADPVTGSQSTWQPELEESVSVGDFTEQARKAESFVVNVRSGAKGADPRGRAWSDY